MDSETALTTPTTAFVTDWTRLAWRLSPAIQSIRRPARLTVITFRFMPDYDDLHFAELPAFTEGISQRIHLSARHAAATATRDAAVARRDTWQSEGHGRLCADERRDDLTGGVRRDRGRRAAMTHKLWLAARDDFRNWFIPTASI